MQFVRSRPRSANRQFRVPSHRSASRGHGHGPRPNEFRIRSLSLASAQKRNFRLPINEEPPPPPYSSPETLSFSFQISSAHARRHWGFRVLQHSGRSGTRSSAHRSGGAGGVPSGRLIPTDDVFLRPYQPAVLFLPWNFSSTLPLIRCRRRSYTTQPRRLQQPLPLIFLLRMELARFQAGVEVRHDPVGRFCRILSRSSRVTQSWAESSSRRTLWYISDRVAPPEKEMQGCDFDSV